MGVRFLVSNGFGSGGVPLSDQDFNNIYKKGCRNGYWSVKEHHKSLKQNAGVAKSPTRTVNTQTNHLFCSILAYIQLEKFKLKTKLNPFELKAKNTKALKATYAELTNIKQ